MEPTQYSSKLRLDKEGIWILKDHPPIFDVNIGGINWSLIENRSFWFQHRNHCLREVFRNYPPSNEIFDVGGGYGCVSSLLQDMGINVVLLEPRYDCAQYARRKRKINPVICSTLEEVGFQENSLPNVGIFDVLEHVEDDLNFLKKIQKSLYPGGRVYLTVPAHSFLWSYEDYFDGHQQRYTLQNLCGKLKQIGFRVEYSTYFFSILILPIFLLRALPYAFGFFKRVTMQSSEEDHILDENSLTAKFLHWHFQRELASIRKKKELVLGASCLVVAIG